MRCPICQALLDVELMKHYPDPVCQDCNTRALDIKGNKPFHSSMGDGGTNPVFIDGYKCWRRYRFGGHIAMLDRFNCASLTEFYKRHGFIYDQQPYVPDKNITRLADLIKQRNENELSITAIINRPANIGHIGEYIASKIFNIALEINATKSVFDGKFVGGNLDGKTVNIKWYGKREGFLDMTSSAPDYYLVMSGPKSNVLKSVGQTRPWCIEHVHLFDGPELTSAILNKGSKPGIATSIKKEYWDLAELWPEQKNQTLILEEDQKSALAMFSPKNIACMNS
ncbi:MAG: hypothetical protein M0R49_08625 [Limnochordia bacterium]|nr:hypothetical protein [Limnochordia bacterium]